MRNILLAAGVAGLVGLFTACGSKEHAGAVDDGPRTGGGTHTTLGGSKSTAGKSGSTSSDGGAGGDGGERSVDPLAPSVTITSPIGVSDPADGVLSGDTAAAICKVRKSMVVGAGAVDRSSVKLSILGADGSVIEEKKAAPTDNDDEYSTEFSLAKVPAGVVGFRCTAADTEKREGSDKVQTLLDKGPTITFIKPTADSAHALDEPLDIEFTVDAAPLADGDDGARVDQVSLDLAGKDIDLSKAVESAGHYRLQVNLADPKLFNPAPTGLAPLTVAATNRRSPEPIKATATEQASIDGTGPTIDIVSPTAGAVVGGNVRLRFSVGDNISGVDPTSVVVSLNMEETAYDSTQDAWSLAGDMFTFEFDSRQINNSKVQITVNIRAKDKVGNAATVATELLYIDNHPPTVDLDPQFVRSLVPGTPPTHKDCSIAFDPVGDRAMNDLDQAVRAGTFRALVWEETNSDSEFAVLHFAGTDQTKTRLYLQPDPAVPLLVDKDGDGKCDDVGKVDNNNALTMDPIAKAGSPWFDDDGAAEPTAASLACSTRPLSEPQLLCTNNKSDMWQVIEHPIKEPAIYAPDVKPGQEECTGSVWEFGTKLSADGWVCFAARAVDNVGNVGISRPLRVCVDDPDRPGVPACANSSIDAPSCTDGCTPPLRLGNVGLDLF